MKNVGENPSKNHYTMESLNNLFELSVSWNKQILFNEMKSREQKSGAISSINISTIFLDINLRYFLSF